MPLVELRFNVHDYASRALERVPDKVRAVLRTAVAQTTKDLAALVRRKLSGGVLHVRSGKLLASIHTELRESQEAISGKVWSEGVAYANIHEFGGRTKPHIIMPVNAKALHFFVGGNEVFAKVVHHPGSLIPERSYLRSSAIEMEGAFRARIMTGLDKLENA